MKTIKSILVLLVMAGSWGLSAQPVESTDPTLINPSEPTPALETGASPPKGPLTLAQKEKRYFVAGEWAPLDLIIPSKWGLYAGLHTNPNQSWELEYLRGSLSVPFFVDDLGGIVDDRFVLTGRTFGGGSFNFFYGLDYMRFRIKLGNDILNRVSGGATEDINVLELYTAGAHVGFGNRWIFKENLIFAVDWFAWTQPLYVNYRNAPYLGVADNSNDRKDVRDLLKFVEYFPRFTLFKISLGLQF